MTNTQSDKTDIGTIAGADRFFMEKDSTGVQHFGTMTEVAAAAALEAGSGTVTSVSVTTADGVSGTVATATTTPAITVILGAITPTTVNGRTVSTDGTKLDTIETSATADQTNAEIKTAYEANADTNAFTDSEQTLLGNQSGTNTGDQTNISGNAATVTTNANLTGHVTSTGNAAILGSFTIAQLNTASSETIKAAGKETIWIPAAAMLPATTSGAAEAQLETTTNKLNYKVLDFDATADEFACFDVAFPKSWNESTVTFQAFWESAGAVTTGIAVAVQGVFVSDNVASDTAYGTAVVVTDDAQSAAGELYVTAESAAVTIAGTPAVDGVVNFRVFRDVSDANDDMTQDMRLRGVTVFFTTDAGNDD